MSVKCQAIMDALDTLAPKYLAENWDNVGLLVGSPVQDINNVLIALDITPAVLEYAIEHKVDMLISHHPLIFNSLKRIRTDLPLGWMLSRLLKADIAVYAAHTNLDIANGGVNDILANKLELQEIETLDVSYNEKLLKLVVFVPRSHAEPVREAMTCAGAGYIGNYSHCTFQTEGTGTFKPLAGTNPFIGRQGVLEFVPECRVETIVTEKISRRVIHAMLKAHPYEEVAYDLYPLVNNGIEFGLGKIGRLAASMTFGDFIQKVKQALSLNYVHATGSLDHVVHKVAVCGGSGASLIHKAAFKGADVLVTGDVKYHEAQEALANRLFIIDAGHFATEQPVVSKLCSFLKQCAAEKRWTVNVMEDAMSSNIFTVV